MDQVVTILSRRRMCLALTFALIFGFAQLMFVTHEVSHPVTGLDADCQLCVLGAPALPPQQMVSAMAHAPIANAPGSRDASASFQHPRLGVGSPRSPPSLMLS